MFDIIENFKTFSRRKYKLFLYKSGQALWVHRQRGSKNF